MHFSVLGAMFLSAMCLLPTGAAWKCSSVLMYKKDCTACSKLCIVSSMLSIKDISFSDLFPFKLIFLFSRIHFQLVIYFFPVTQQGSERLAWLGPGQLSTLKLGTTLSIGIRGTWARIRCAGQDTKPNNSASASDFVKTLAMVIAGGSDLLWKKHGCFVFESQKIWHCSLIAWSWGCIRSSTSRNFSQCSLACWPNSRIWPQHVKRGMMGHFCTKT